ncbi:50S ribosomal protein L24 [Planctomycetia bacterium]|nr:50S ribosomal protein L24 [Planctomycetia bacterium]
MLIKSGDLVEVRSGDSRGVRGKVLAVRPGKAAGAGPRVVVEGVNRVYRHIKRSQKNPQGGRLSKELPIDASNVLIVCAACGKATRLGARVSADGGKVRFCRACNAELGVLRRPRGATAATKATKATKA